MGTRMIAMLLGTLLAAASAQAQQTEQAPPAPPPAPEAAPQAAPQGALVPQVVAVIGKPVVGADGKEMGEVKNVLIGQDGSIRAVVVERGGLFGGKTVAVPVESLAFSDFEQRILLNMPEEQVSQLPEYKGEGDD